MNTIKTIELVISLTEEEQQILKEASSILDYLWVNMTNNSIAEINVGFNSYDCEKIDEMSCALDEIATEKEIKVTIEETY